MLLLKISHAEHCKDDKRRSFYEFYFDNILILKQKIPFDLDCDEGFNTRYTLENVYLFNYSIFQTRNGRCVRFPVSRKVVKDLVYDKQEKYLLGGIIKFGKIFLKN